MKTNEARFLKKIKNTLYDMVHLQPQHIRYFLFFFKQKLPYILRFSKNRIIECNFFSLGFSCHLMLRYEKTAANVTQQIGFFPLVNLIVLTLPVVYFHSGCLCFEFEAHVLLFYNLSLLRCFCGLYDLNSYRYFFSSNSSVYFGTTIHA